MRKGVGGLPERRPDQEFTPPAAVITPGSRSEIFRGRLVTVSGGAATGVYVYNGPPALGNLLASIIGGTTGGTDLYGNATIGPDIVVYGPDGAGGWKQYCQVVNSGLVILDADGSELLLRAFAAATSPTSRPRTRLLLSPVTGLTSGVSLDLYAQSAGSPAQASLSRGSLAPEPATGALLEIQGDLSQQALAALTAGSVTNSVAESTIGSVVIPALDPAAGSTYRLVIYGTVSSAAATPGTLRLRLRIAGQLLAVTAALALPVSLAAARWSATCELDFEAIGATGILDAHTVWAFAAATALTNPADSESAAANTTAAMTIGVTAAFSVASASNICTTTAGGLVRDYH